MNLQFSTICNVYGNRYQVEIDSKNKTYKVGYHLFANRGINVTKKAIKEIVKQLELQGFKELERYE